MLLLPCNGLIEPAGEGHLVQFYGSNHTSLARNVAKFLQAGLALGEPCLVVATESHIKQFQKLVSPAPGQTLVYVDALEALTKFMIGGRPDWGRFQFLAYSAIRNLRRTPPSARIRIFGEMVGLLWSAGQHAAAIRLEQFWNRILRRSSVKLYCAYPIDTLSSSFDPKFVEGVLCNHAHVLPTTGAGFDRFLLDAIDDFLGDRTVILRRAIVQNKTRWAVMPKSEALILALRKEAPNQADRILQLASLRFRDSCGAGTHGDKPALQAASRTTA